MSYIMIYVHYGNDKKSVGEGFCAKRRTLLEKYKVTCLVCRRRKKGKTNDKVYPRGKP